MDRNEALRKACLAATVAVAWAGSSSPAQAQGPEVGDQTVYIRTNFYHSITDASFIALNGLTYIRMGLGSLDSGQSFRSVTVSGGTGSGGGTSSYAFLGRVSGTIVNGTHFTSVILGFVSGPSVIGQTFEGLFPGYSEAQIYDALGSAGGSSVLDSFLSRLASSPLTQLGINGSAYETYHFSNATFGGTIEASFTPIPEPMTAMVCLGALGVGVITRRRA